MLALHESQQRFAAAVFGEDSGDFERHIHTLGLTGAQRLQVYRNNTRLSLTGALGAVYPVVQRLVGEGFFEYAAAQYIAYDPSRSGDLHRFGGSFATFLETFEPATELCYLPDMARLEWACHEVFHAERHPPLDPSALATVSAERQGELRFKLHPATRFVESAFPVLRIWQVNQDDYNGDLAVQLDEGGIKLLVFRNENLDIELQPLPEGEFHLLRTLVEGGDFATACEQAMTVQPDFDLPAGFRRHVLQGVLVDYSLTDF
ncbi:MAG: putative DNA-binding domain-containing protein [Gammaproteobacteria bacterium]|nr:putative DNA-binding domain-containing protein [Gammaproteobacteria bacterium]